MKGKGLRLADDVRRIQRLAAAHDGRVVTLGPLVLFSAVSGDARMLDPPDHLATPLAQEGDPLPVHLEETDTTFAIGWSGHYRIADAAFRLSGRYVRSRQGNSRLPDPPASPTTADAGKISNIFG